jgi:hypothetical protein
VHVKRAKFRRSGNGYDGFSIITSSPNAQLTADENPANKAIAIMAVTAALMALKGR